MDLPAEKAKRDARIQAKRERISAEADTPAPETTEVNEPAPAIDESKVAQEENLQDNRPRKKVE